MAYGSGFTGLRFEQKWMVGLVEDYSCVDGRPRMAYDE